MTELSTEQEFAANDETEFAIRSICGGLQELTKLGPAHDRPAVALQLLAQGFERLAKVVLILGYLEQDGRLMSLKKLRDYGHRVDDLLVAVVTLCERADYGIDRPAIRDDIDFMKANPLLAQLIQVISDFGDGGRYQSLNVLLGGDTENGPAGAFQELTLSLLDAHPEWIGKIGTADFSGFYPVIYGDMVEALQRLGRALCRTFTLGLLGARGRLQTGAIQPFLFLMDDDLRSISRRCEERYL